MNPTIPFCCALLLAGRALTGQSINGPSAHDPQACVALARAADHRWLIQSAQFVLPPFHTSLMVRARKLNVTVTIPFCRVVGTVKPTPASSIRFELWLPPRAKWNGKFQGVGSGASWGQIDYDKLVEGLARGYATVATDNGHESVSGYDVSWALGRPERIVDFGYRAEHTVTRAAKALTKSFYGKAPRHSYFVGCSQGGHHGMMEAQRFPEDYDGIVAGAPVYSWTGEMTGQAWNARALQRTPTRALPPQKLQLLSELAVTACGGADGVVEDPQRCSFDVGRLQCNGADQTSCLPDTEIEAARQMYAGPKTSAGVQIYPGLPRGGESGWARLWSDPERLGGSWLGFYRFMVFQDPGWDLAAMDFDRDPVLAKHKVGGILDPDNPDLARFANRGGKIIVYHGWADGMVPSQVSIDYFDSIAGRLGPKRVNDFYRLFWFLACGIAEAAPAQTCYSIQRTRSQCPWTRIATCSRHWSSG